jgi:hypothetical protein
MATSTRIYFLNIEGVVYLVRAATPATALAHVTRRIASVRVATQDDLVNSLADGVEVETAGEEPAAQPEPAATPDGASEPLWPMPTPIQPTQPALSGFTDMPTPQPEDDDEDEDGEGDTPAGSPATRQRIPYRYRDPLTGSTWSGRGLKPTWLRVELANGRTLAEFDIANQVTA